ncbi:MAG: hypothetical protein ACE5DM_02875 [Candidatus Nanoarchaeia archaeon]
MNKNILLALLILLVIPLAAGDLNDLVQPLKDTGLPLGDLLVQQHGEIKGYKTEQLTDMYHFAENIIKSEVPDYEDPETFPAKLKAKKAAYEYAELYLRTLIDITKEELNDPEMEMIHDEAQTALKDLLEKKQKLQDWEDDDVNHCEGEPGCEPNGIAEGPGWCIGANNLPLWNCEYEDGDHTADLQSDKIDELSGKDTSSIWDYWWAIPLIFLFLFLIFWRLGRGGAFLGFSARAGMFLIWLVTWPFKLIMRLIRMICRGGRGTRPVPTDDAGIRQELIQSALDDMREGFQDFRTAYEAELRWLRNKDVNITLAGFPVLSDTQHNTGIFELLEARRPQGLEFTEQNVYDELMNLELNNNRIFPITPNYPRRQVDVPHTTDLWGAFNDDTKKAALKYVVETQLPKIFRRFAKQLLTALSAPVEPGFWTSWNLKRKLLSRLERLLTRFLDLIHDAQHILLHGRRRPRGQPAPPNPPAGGANP